MSYRKYFRVRVEGVKSTKDLYDLYVEVTERTESETGGLDEEALIDILSEDQYEDVFDHYINKMFLMALDSPSDCVHTEVVVNFNHYDSSFIKKALNDPHGGDTAALAMSPLTGLASLEILENDIDLYCRQCVVYNLNIRKKKR